MEIGKSSLAKQQEINTEGKSQSRRQICKEQWILSTVVSRAEGVFLRSRPTFVFPGVHTELISRPSRDGRADPAF